MITQSLLIQLLEQIHYKPHVSTGFIHGLMGNGFYIQHWQCIPDCNELPGDFIDQGVPARQKGRKWYISKHMSQSEIVQTCLAAVLAFEEHEVRECFEYRDHHIFKPHMNIKDLMVASHGKDVREETNDGIAAAN